MRAILSMAMIWIMLAAHGALAQTAGQAPAMVQGTGAGDQSLPPFDLLVFLDRSKTIFTGAGAGAPNERVAEMLRTVFERQIDGGRRTFVAAGDRVNLYTFGSDVKTIAERVDGGSREALNAAVGRFGDVAGDENTDFSRLLTAVTENPVLNARDNRLKLVMIASDFVDDPFNNARRTKDKLGVCDLLDQYRNGKKTRLDPQIKSLADLLEQSAAGGSVRPYVGMLIVEPKKEDYPGLKLFADNKDNYLNCVLQTVAAAAIPTTLAENIGAEPIRYDEVANDADAFAKRFVDAVFRATLPRLLIEGGECRQRRQGIECTLALRNSARVSNAVSRVRFFPDGKDQVPFDVSANIRLAPGQAGTLTLPIPAPEAARLAAGRIVVAIEDEGVGTSARKEIGLNIPSAPIMRSIESSRTLATEPLKVTAMVENPNREPIVPKALRFFDAETAGNPLGESLLDTATAFEPGGSAALTVAAPLLAQQRLLRSEPVYATAGFMMPDSETPLESQRLRVGIPNLTPLIVSKARVESAEGSQTEFDLLIDVQNSSGPSKRVTEVRLFSKSEGEPPVGSIVVPQGQEIGPLPVPLRLRLPSSVSQLVTGSLYVAVVDSQTGQPSAIVAATAPPTLAQLRLTKAEIRPAAEDGRFELEAVVENPGGANSSVMEISLHSGQGGPLFKRLVVPGPRRTVGGRRSQTVIFPLTEESDRDVVETRGLEAGCIDGLGKECANRIAVANSLRPTPLQIRSAAWGEPKDGNPTLALDFFNPGGISVTLERLFVERPGNPAGRLQLPLPNPVDVGYQKTVRVSVVYREEIWEQAHPRDRVMLVPECKQVDCTGVKREVPALPETALIMSKEGVSWTVDGAAPSVTITVRNPLGFPQPVKSVWLAADETGRQSMLVTNYAGAARPRVPERPGELKLPVAFGPETMGLLGGEQIFLCVVGAYDADALAESFNCRQPWLAVPVGNRSAVKPLINPENAFERQARRLTVRAVNDGALPQKVFAVAVDPADGGKPMLISLPAPVTVNRGQSIPVQVPLSPEDVTRLEAAGTAKVAFVDMLNRMAPPDNRIATSEAVLETNHYEIKVTDAKRHVVYGSGGRANVIAHIKVTRQSLGYGDHQKVMLWLADAGGGKLPGTDKEIDLTFNGQKAVVAPVWVIKPDANAITGSIAHAHASIAGKLPSAADALVEVDELRGWMNEACTYLFVLGAGILGAGLLLRTRWLRQKIRFLQKLRLPGGSLNHILTNAANFTTIFGGLSITPSVVRWFTEEAGAGGLHNWLTNSIGVLIAENVFICALIGGVISLSSSIWINCSIAKTLQNGVICIEFQELIERRLRSVFFVVNGSAVGFFILAILFWMILINPYENLTGIHEICVGLSCQQN